VLWQEDLPLVMPKPAHWIIRNAPDFIGSAQMEVLQLDKSMQTENRSECPAMAVRQAAELAKLALSPEEEAAMSAELEAILAFAQELQQADTQGVPMTAHVVPTENVLREDAVIPSFDRETLLRSAPTRTEEYMSVPKTFE